MEPLNSYTPEVDLEKYVTPQIVTAMQDFIEHLEYFVGFAESILEFPHLSEEKRGFTIELHAYAIGMKQVYFTSMQDETVEDLESRQADIFSEMNYVLSDLNRCEIDLDHCLIFADSEPTFHPQFPDFPDAEIIPSKTARC